MAAGGKFTLPSVDDLDEGVPSKRVKKLFQAHRKLLSDKLESAEKGELKVTNKLGESCRGTTSHETQQVGLTVTRITVGAKSSGITSASGSHQRSVETSTTDHSRKHVVASENLGTADNQGQGERLVGRNFQETFAFLKDSHHYKEAVEQIQAASSKAKE